MSDLALRQVVNRLHKSLKRDALIQTTTDKLRHLLAVERVVLYYFYSHWEGQVTFESLSDQKFSIFGSTGPNDCFNGEYAAMYEAGRVRAIADLTTEPITECHRQFLLDLQVRANLVVPVLNHRGLWGLLVAHSCSLPRVWLPEDIAAMEQAAQTLATAPAIQDS